jgi:hypothetical protein
VTQSFKDVRSKWLHTRAHPWPKDKGLTKAQLRSLVRSADGPVTKLPTGARAIPLRPQKPQPDLGALATLSRVAKGAQQ